MLSILIQFPDDLYNISLFRRYTRTRRERWVIGPAGRPTLTIEETEAVEVRAARSNWWATRPVVALTPQPEVLPYLEVAYSDESDNEVEYLEVRRVSPAPPARPPRLYQRSAPPISTALRPTHLLAPHARRRHFRPSPGTWGGATGAEVPISVPSASTPLPELGPHLGTRAHSPGCSRLPRAR